MVGNVLDMGGFNGLYSYWTILPSVVGALLNNCSVCIDNTWRQLYDNRYV